MEKRKNVGLKRAAAVVLALVMSMALGVSAFASNDPAAGVNSAVSTALSGVQTNALSLISTILPYALGIMGAVLVVMIGIKVFKSIAKK